MTLSDFYNNQVPQQCNCEEHHKHKHHKHKHHHKHKRHDHNNCCYCNQNVSPFGGNLVGTNLFFIVLVLALIFLTKKPAAECPAPPPPVV
jgi:hypothetical protein